MTVCIHWPARHISSAALDTLQETLGRHALAAPDGHDVLLVVSTTETYSLGVHVRPSPTLRREVAAIDEPWIMTLVHDDAMGPPL